MPRETTDTAAAAFAVLTAAVAFTLILATSLLTFTASIGHAASPRVRMACMGDYLAHCSQHPEESAAVRRCMSAHGQQLSKGCLNALVAAGEVSRSEVERRKTAGR